MIPAAPTPVLDPNPLGAAPPRLRVDLSRCLSPHSFGNKAARALWQLVWLLFYRPSPRIFFGWRRFLLRLFGAKIGRTSFVYPAVKIWAPWNLEIGEFSCVSDAVDCYCVDRITIGSHATVSQYCFLCSASHNYEHPHLPLITAPIRIGDGAWLTADVFVAPGVVIGEGAVVGARSCVFSDVPPWTVVAGNPARFLKPRQLKMD